MHHTYTQSNLEIYPLPFKAKLCQRCPGFLKTTSRNLSPPILKNGHAINPAPHDRIHKSLPKYRGLKHTPSTEYCSSCNTMPQHEISARKIKQETPKKILHHTFLPQEVLLLNKHESMQKSQQKDETSMVPGGNWLKKESKKSDNELSGSFKKNNIWSKLKTSPKFEEINGKMMNSYQSLAEQNFEKQRLKIFPRRMRSESFQVSLNSPLIRNQQISQYQFINLLGKGTTAQVFLARHKTIKMVFALKIIRKEILQDKKIADGVMSEIENSWKVRDPHVVALYDVFDDNEKIYLVMEYLHSGSLFDLWREKKNFHEHKVAEYMLDICKGIQALHSKHIIHRDIKLENIMLQCGVAKIGDLGCSIHTQNMQITYCGSPSYLSPEQLAHHFYNSKIDMWSIGIMTYELLFGYSPYQQDIYEIIVKRHKHHLLPKFQFPYEPRISENARNFISGLLDQNIDKRLSAEEALQHEFLKSASTRH